MFDPERDADPGSRPFYIRLLVTAVIALAGCAALWPSVRGFSAGVDHGATCLAVSDGWHHDMAAVTAAQDAAVNAAYPAPPTEADGADPSAMARWHAQWEAAQSNPAVQHANDYEAWKQGAGACVDASRHRLIVSAVSLSALVFVVGVGALAARLRFRFLRLTAPST